MPLFARSSKSGGRKKSDLVQSPTEEVPGKELNSSSNFTDEKMALNQDEHVNEPSSAASFLPAYRERDVSTVSGTVSSRRSGTHSSQNTSDLGPDVHPVTTQRMLMPDDGLEVYIPENADRTQLSAPPQRQASKSYREYNFYYTNAMTHLIICDPDQKVLHFAEMSPFAKGMPDVSLRDILTGGFDDLAGKGPGLSLKEAQQAPVMAVADAIPSSKHIKVGFGDPLQPESQRWAMMRNVHDDPKTNSEKFDVNFKDGNGKESNYLWIKGAADNAADKGNSKELYRMLSDDGVIASFRTSSITTIKKRGSLRVYDVPANEELLVFIFLTCAALCEKERRRKVKKAFLFGAS